MWGLQALLVWLLPTSISTLASPATKGHSDADIRNQRTSVTRAVQKIHYHHVPSNSTLSYVSNSGLCETTPGVNQHSGYISVGTNMSMFFWFFEARHNASEAPIVTWFQGGPGCSSMIGLFQENGPCRFVNGSSEPSLNPYSWNEEANMLYIDQPIGAGFSFGDINVANTYSAAPYVWNLLQAVFSRFPTYRSRELGIFTESYGGHYAPEFARYIISQNDKIERKQITGEVIKLKTLGINNGWIDAVDGYKAQITYAENNPYKPLINSTRATLLLAKYNRTCLPALLGCADTDTDSDCGSSQYFCTTQIQGPISRTGAGSWSVYDIRVPKVNTEFSETYIDWLRRPDIQRRIGAEKIFERCSDASGDLFQMTGDDSRPFTAALSAVVQAEVPTLLWAGDADWICNYQGIFDTANKVNYTSQRKFAATKLRSYNVSGKPAGTYKREGALNYLVVHGAGHQVMHYAPEASLQVFRQMLKGGGLVST